MAHFTFYLYCMLLTQALVGQRYGARHLQTSIPAGDFERIRTALSGRHSSRGLRHAVALLDACYELDENSVEPERVYVLTYRNSVSSPQSVGDPAEVRRQWHLALVAFVVISYLYLHCALSLAAQCIAIGPVCVFVPVCLWVCYHDNSKLRASILTKLGL